ncbi:MAG: hypothetical protein QOG68_2698 [Solirubrobacteraceae bacterium]|nr:hypothetical protein [Solirubrobacteraceae bacterium]
MLGKPSKRTQKRLEETGRHAPAEVLAVAERGMAITSGPEGLVSSTEVLLKTTLRVEPDGEPAFEVTKRIRYGQLSQPFVGQRVNVIFDPDDHDDLIIDHSAAAAVGGAALGAGLGAMAGTDVNEVLSAVREAQQQAGGDPMALAAALRESLGAKAVVTSMPGFAANPEDDRLGQLEKLGQLHTQGVLTDAEFAAEKQKILQKP